jgi:hypothetical protein
MSALTLLAEEETGVGRVGRLTRALQFIHRGIFTFLAMSSSYGFNRFASRLDIEDCDELSMHYGCGLDLDV